MQRLRGLLSGNLDLAAAALVLSVTTITIGAAEVFLPLYAESLGASEQQWG